jgi:putative restriction endonuclease
MNIYVGVTDNGWFKYLAARQPDEVNFWRPGGARGFHVLQPGEPFLFKLHSPDNYVAGGGFFVKHTTLPVSLAWAAFGEKNGAAGAEVFSAMIAAHRKDNHPDPMIGCTILTQPFFFPREQWIPVPGDFSLNLMMGKAYRTEAFAGEMLWEQVRERLSVEDDRVRRLAVAEAAAPRYGKEFLTRARLGQGAFRILVTDAYHRRCSATGERTLPVLEASHIRPFAKEGPNLVRNGVLLRSDLHTLYDQGYLTVAPDHHIEVSKRIRDEFKNGHDYYALHGHKLTNLPDDESDRPSVEFLEWHNQHVYVA